MKKGIVNAVLFYLIGFGIAWLIYLIYGHPYIHAPGFHHLIILFTLIIGSFWTIYSISIFFFKRKSKKRKSNIITNLIVIFGFVIYFTSSINNTNIKNTESSTKNQIISKSRGDTTYVYHDGNLVFIKVKDSILLNLMDNIPFKE